MTEKKKFFRAERNEQGQMIGFCLGSVRFHFVPYTDSLSACKPACNVDGTIMCGAVDARGRMYGATDHK